MKTWSKLLAVLVVIVLLVSTAAGCTNGSSQTDKPDPTSTPSSNTDQGNAGEETAKEDPFGKYEEPIVVTAVRSLGSGSLDFPEGDDIENNVWTRLYEEALNIKVEYLWTTNDAQYEQKLNIAITSDDLPDLIPAKNTQLKMMYENDQLMEVGDILDGYMADFTKEIMYSDGGAGINSATFDNGLYAIPQVGTGLGSTKVLWVRMDWLENLGLELPGTVEDLMNIIDKFTNEDPDKNGQNDTFGLAVHGNLFDGGFASLEGFFNAYGAYPNIWVKGGDGKLAYGSVQPEAKEALGVLREMYADGRLDSEFGVKDSNKVNEDVAAGKVGLMFGDFWNAAWINDVKVENPEFEWKPIAIPSRDGKPAKAQMPFGTSNYFAVNKKAEHPEAFVKLLNLQLEKNYGKTAEPTKYNITPEGFGPYAYTVISVEPPMKNFIAAEKVTKAIETGDTSGLNDEEKNYYDMSKLSLEGDHSNNNWHQLKMFGPEGSLTVMKKYWDDGNVVPNEFYGAPTQTMTEKLSTLQKQQLTDFTSIILGESLDYFDTFVQNWNNLGGAQITEEVNEWYADQQ